MAVLAVISVLTACTLCLFDVYYAEKTFQVQFQSDGDWSKDEWVENDAKIPDITEFTVCHWEKAKNVFSSYRAVWSYCSTSANERSFKCVQLDYRGNPTYAYRDVIFEAYFSGWTDESVSIPFPVNSFRHNTWNHFCWSYSGRTSRNKFYYNGRMIADVVIEKGLTPLVFEGNDDISSYAFLIGQEPDSLRSGYAADQAFYGSIAEVNMWDKVMDDDEIATIGNCEELKKGNILSWDKKKLKINRAKIEDVDDHAFFCKQQTDIVIFPERHSLSSASEVCSTVGGKIVLPKSKKENKAIYEMAVMHRIHCIEEKSLSPNFGKLTWIGMQNFQANSLNHTKPNETHYNYTNWGNSHLMRIDTVKNRIWKCAYMIEDYFWGLDYSDAGCDSLSLCPICSIPRTPIFTIKGLCHKGSLFHWNYYLVQNKSHQISMYESYNGEQRIMLKNDEWQMNIKGAEIKLNKGNHLVGRREWDWYEHSCNVKKFQKRNLTISMCDFGREFTCNSGSCVSIGNRCDGIHDCLDGSDEEQCKRIDIPNSYEQIKPPQQKPGSNEDLHVYTKVTIENINVIDMKNMFIGVTIKVDMMWKDSRLLYRHLIPGVQNIVSHDDSGKIWQPLDHIAHENSIIGKIYTDAYRTVSLFSNVTEFTTDIYSSYEDLVSRGEESWLNIIQRFRIDYTCIFDLTKYPFDYQQCEFIMYIRSTPAGGISLRGHKPAVVYIGRKVVSQFRIINATLSIRTNCRNCTTNIEQSKFIFALNMKRNHRDAVTRLIFPSCILWFMAYLTLFIKVEDFTNRNRISITILLALITLFGSVSVRDDFPTTTYLKYIDMWFIWYFMNIFLIITSHILLAKFVDATTKIEVRIHPQSMTDSEEEAGFTKQDMTKVGWINNVALVFLPIVMVVFNVVYFYMTV